MFAFDSYSTLVANFQQMEEIQAQFAQPLQDLQKSHEAASSIEIEENSTTPPRAALGSVVRPGSGTTVVLHPPTQHRTMEAPKHSDRLFLSSRNG